MSDKYYRLITFVVNICPRPLRELFIAKAKADTNHSYTSLEDYLLFRKPDIDKLRRRFKITLEQLGNVYPAVGSVDIQTWDVALLAVLLTQLFSNQLNQTERSCLRVITDIRNSLQHIANTDVIDDQKFNTDWSVLRDAVLALSKCTGAPSLSNIEDEIKSALSEGMPNLVQVIRTWNQVVCIQLQLQNSELTNEIKTLKEESMTSNKILTKASVKRKGSSVLAEKRMKIVDNKINKMKENLAKALTEENNCTESFKDDIALITQQLIDNHRVIVTGHDNMLIYKCALAAVKQRNYQSTEQCLEINSPSDWKLIYPEDAQFVLFREPFGMSTYDSQKVETMLEELDSMLDATNDENDEVIDIIIVTNQKLLNEVVRQNEHDMLSLASTVYIDSTSENTPEEACATEDIIYRRNLLVDSWETCLQSPSESAASCLLENNKLPNKRQLEEIAKTFEGKQKSSIMRKCCSKISENIKGRSEKIIGVWPAYRIDEDGKTYIAFVICTNEDIDLENKLEYEYTIRVIGKGSNEARDATFSEENIRYKMSSDEAKNIKTFIAKNSSDLLKRHSMLSGISASSIKSKKYGTSKWEKVPCPCVLFYVHTKNYIPLDEDPFEKEYDGIPVDVREGAFTRFGRDGHCSTKHQPDVKIACEVGGANSSGTLSGFLELPGSTDIFGFTCAHSVLSTDVLSKYLLKSGKKSFDIRPANADEKLGSMVYQPANSEEVLGNVVQVAYQEGENGTSGMEIAIIKLQKARCPISGEISDFESNENEHTFGTGKVAERASIQYGEDVLKFGSASGISEGRISFDDATVRELAFPWNKDVCEFKLHKQLEVWSLNLQEKFAVKGDSGAPVYVSRNKELNCVGIVEGGYDIGNCVVTPVDELLRKLAIPSLKKFRGYPTRMETSETTNIKQDVLPRHERKRRENGNMLKDRKKKQS